VLQLLGASLIALEVEAESRFRDAEKVWYGNGANGSGECTEVVVEVEKEKLKKGETTKVEIKVRAKKDGKEVRASLAAAGCPGDVAPKAAKFDPGRTAKFDYTAPAQGINTPCFTVRSTGRTGRGEGGHTWPGPTTFLVTAEGTQTTTWTKRFTSVWYPECPNVTGNGTQTLEFRTAGPIKVRFVRDPGGSALVLPLQGASIEDLDVVVLEALTATVERQGTVVYQGGSAGDSPHCPAGGGVPPTPDCGTRQLAPFTTELALGLDPTIGGGGFSPDEEPYVYCYYEDALETRSEWEIFKTKLAPRENSYELTPGNVFERAVDFHLGASATVARTNDIVFSTGDTNHTESATVIELTVSLIRVDDQT
jgi:hypothetical protein